MSGFIVSPIPLGIGCSKVASTMILAFLVMTVYVPGHIGFVLPTGWAVMLLGAPLLLLSRSVQFTTLHFLGLLLVVYSAISLLWAPNGYWGFTQILAMAGVFMLASTEGFEIEPTLKGLALGLLVSDLVYVSQLFGFKGVIDASSSSGSGSGLFVNPNIFAEVSALILVLLLTHKMWFYSLIALPGLMFMTSRSVILGLIGSAVVWIWQRSKLTAGIVIIFGSVLIPLYSLDRTGSILQRVGIWRDMLPGLTMFGNGVGSFEYLFPLYNVSFDPTVSRSLQAHNEFLQIMFELGFVGFAIFSLIILLNLDSKYVPWFVCFAIISCFGFPLHISATAFMFAIVMGYLSNSNNTIRYKFSSFGPALFVRMEK